MGGRRTLTRAHTGSQQYSFSHSGSPPGPLSPLPWCLHILLMKKFVKEEKKTRSMSVRSSAALTETCYNLREQKAPLRPLLLLFCSNYAAALYRFQWNSYEQLSHPSSSWIFLLNQLNPQFSRRQSKCDGENQVGVARTEDFAHNLVEE